MQSRATTGTDLALRCRCGAVRAVLEGASAAAGNRAVCYCADCQAFAQHLGRAGDVLDARGGTDIFQTTPARLRIVAGADRLAILRLTPRGLLRWYASCCSTPLWNTSASASLPFVGVILAGAERPAGDAALERTLGPVRMHGFRKSAVGGASGLPRDATPLPLAIARLVALAAGWKLRGDAKRSPLFDAATRQPVAVPVVLTAEERARLPRAGG